MKHLKFVKPVNFAITLFAIFFTISSFAQKDTTSIKIGDKKLMIIDSRVRTSGKIEKLAKGIVKFTKEIVKSEIKIVETEKKIDSLKDKKSKTSGDELTEIENEITKNEAVVVEENKKIEAFEKGIDEIEKGIDALEIDLENITELKELEEMKELEELEKLEEELEELEGQKYSKRQHRRYAKRHRCSKFNGHYSGLELGLVNFGNNSNQLASDSEIDFMELDVERSIAFSLNFLEYNVPLYKKNIGILTGAGIEWNSFSLHRNIDLEVNENDVVEAVQIPTEVREYKKNKLNMAYLTVPIICEFQIPIGRKRLYTGIGITGSLRLWSKQKQKYFIDDEKHKYKNVDDFELAPLRYGLSARIGYGDIGIFANYSLVQLFKEDSGPELYPFSVGIRISF